MNKEEKERKESQIKNIINRVTNFLIFSIVRVAFQVQVVFIVLQLFEVINLSLFQMLSPLIIFIVFYAIGLERLMTEEKNKDIMEAERIVRQVVFEFEKENEKLESEENEEDQEKQEEE